MGHTGAYPISLKCHSAFIEDVRHINAYQIFKNFHSLRLRYGAYWAIPDFVNIVTLRLRMMWGILGIPDFVKMSLCVDRR